MRSHNEFPTYSILALFSSRDGTLTRLLDDALPDIIVIPLLARNRRRSWDVLIMLGNMLKIITLAACY
jgi:hypothetical protein